MEKPLRALELITGLSKTIVATKSYELFGTIMESGVAVEKKMEAARLALHAAYRSGLESVPPVGDPKHILDFLRFHVGSHVGREERSHAVSSVMRAIDSASNDPMSQSQTRRTEAVDNLLAEFIQPPYPEEFEWWYGVLWCRYGGLDLSVPKKVGGIGMDDRVDLKKCRNAIEKEMKRVKKLGGVTNIVTLEETHSRLTAFIDHREKVCDKFSGIWTGLISFPPRCIFQFCPSHDQLVHFI